MTPPSDQPARSTVRTYLRAGGALAAALLALNLVAALRDRTDEAFAAPTGALTIVKGAAPGAGAPLTTGGSATEFALTPDAGAACTGDGTKGYRIQTFIVSSDVDPGLMAFDASGPSPASTGTTVRLPLFNSGNPVLDLNPALTTGALTGIPTFSFAINGFTASLLPNGTYTMGIACTLETATGKTLDKYWTVKIDIAANPADVPTGLVWTLNTGLPPVTTTTAAVTTTTVAVTTTTAPAVTTTTAPAVTTTTAPAVTTTTAPAVTTTTAPAVTTTTAPAVTTTTAPAVTTTTAPAVTTTTAPTTTTTSPREDCRGDCDRDRGDRGDRRGRGKRCEKPRGAGDFDDDDHHHRRGGRAEFVAI